MRKNLLLLLALACASGASAGETVKLVGAKSTDNIEEMKYSYDEANRVIKICHDNQDEPMYNTVRVFKYNDKNQCVSEELYQDMDILGTWNIDELHYNSKIEYVWNDNGTLSERLNYNNWSTTAEPEMTLGGVTEYEYDAAGLLTCANIYWDSAKTMLGQKTEYTYDTKGQLIKRTDWMPDWMSGDMTLVGATEYTYLDNGLRATESVSYDNGMGSLIVDSYVKYVYDADGNLTQKSVEGQSGEARERYDFTFFSPQEQPAPAQDVTYPINIEDDVQNFLYEHFPTLVLSRYDVWALSISTDQLEHYATYDMIYGNGDSGVKGVLTDSQTFGLRAFSKDNISLDGIGNGRVRFYDMSGRLVMDANAVQGSVDISRLPSGNYCVYTATGTVKIRK